MSSTKVTKAMKAAVEGLKGLNGEFTYDYRFQYASNASGSVVISKLVFDKLSAAGLIEATDAFHWIVK